MHHVDAVNVSGTELSLVDLDDGALLTMARTGHQEAYATLFSRYSYAAHRLARHLGQKEDSDDVVSEAFAQVLDLLGRGKGPERAFRAYLFTTVRHECARRAKARKRVTPTDDLRQIDTPVAFGGGQLDAFERSAIRSAYESLPPRWQTVLWHLDVEGRKPHELGPLLDMSANSVSALVYRARAGLREAYLQQHVKDERPGDDRTCLEYRAKLSAFVRGTSTARDQERIHTHLQSCSACMAIYLDLKEVNREVGAIAVPVAVAAAAGLSLASVGANLALLLKGVAASFLVPAAAVASVASVASVGLALHDPSTLPLASAVQTLSSDAAPAVGPKAERAPDTSTPSAAGVSGVSVSSSSASLPSATLRPVGGQPLASVPTPPAPAAPAPPAVPAAPVAPAAAPAATPKAAVPLSLPLPAVKVPDLGLAAVVTAAGSVLGSVLDPAALRLPTSSGGNLG